MTVQNLVVWRIRARLGARFLAVLQAFVEMERRRPLEPGATGAGGEGQ